MTAEKVIDLAESYIGTAESPANSNNVIFNTHYYGNPVKGANYAWCCTFVWDVFRMAGASTLFYDGKKTAYCPAVQDWAKKNKLTVGKTQGQKGDLVLFDWNKNNAADHIGFILENKGNGTYTTVEGNTSVTSNDNGGKVMQRTRKTSDILMIIRPKYETEKLTENPVSTSKQTIEKAEICAGNPVTLKSKNLYASSTSKVVARKLSGTFYFYDGKEINGRYRITSKPSNANKSPAILYVTGWVDKGAVV